MWFERNVTNILYIIWMRLTHTLANQWSLCLLLLTPQQMKKTGECKKTTTTKKHERDTYSSYYSLCLFGWYSAWVQPEKIIDYMKGWLSWKHNRSYFNLKLKWKTYLCINKLWTYYTIWPKILIMIHPIIQFRKIKCI